MKPIRSFTFHHLLTNTPICTSCLSSLSLHPRFFTLCGYEGEVLYDYNDFFRSLLYQYKGQYDYALKDVFLKPHRQYCRKYKDYIVAVVPSDTNMNNERKFAPNESIARTVFPHVYTGLYKTTSYKQALQSFDQRHQVINHIDIRFGEYLRNQNVLLFDDVMTSTYTLQACLHKIEAYQPASIHILVLSSRKKKRRNA